MNAVRQIKGKQSQVLNVRPRKLTRNRLKYIVNLVIFGIALAWLINS